MTEKEAIKEMMGASVMVLSNEKKFSSSMKVAMKALEDVQRYREIGTVEECRVAVEKQKPMKPIKTETEGYMFTDTYRCPTCGGNFSGTGIADYCYHCGQKLDWSE